MKLGYRYGGAVFLAGMITIIIALSFATAKDYSNQFSDVTFEIIGNNHLDSGEYLKFAKLNRARNSGNVSVNIIRDRLQKHPYIDKLNVKFTDSKNLELKIFEKKFDILLMSGDRQYLVSETMEAVPLLQYTRNVDYPIVSYPSIDSLKKFTFDLSKDNRLFAIFKVLKAMSIKNEEMYQSLSEIDLSEINRVHLFFADTGYKVILGGGSKYKQIISLSKLWKYLRNAELDKQVRYIDMSYGERIFIGMESNTKAEGGKNI
jgi:cell division protein FtsQ